MNTNTNYCQSITKYIRRKTRVVQIGDIPLGGEYPIRIQSMTTTDTMDTNSTVSQCIRMIDAGSDYVRITAPSIKEAKNLGEIKSQLKKRGYTTPIIADIHFTPNAALEAAQLVEKIRINPGNFADKKKFQYIDYSDQSYNEELERINTRFSPLVKLCKERGIAMRIGSNHGSLSDRILSKYGDTPLGMVESALEFIRICESYSYHDIVLSMKASNTLVMVQAYRLLVNIMDKEGMNYPLHLGVTEAGEGEDGRIKSSVGIGALMEDGLGDTIRVSLTEEPENEIPVAKSLVDRYLYRAKHKNINANNNYPINPFEYHVRDSRSIENIGGKNVPRVIVDLSIEDEISYRTFQKIGYTYFFNEDKWGISDLACDYIFIKEKKINFELPGTLGVIQPYSLWSKENQKNYYPLLDVKQYLTNTNLHATINFVQFSIEDISDDLINKIKNDSSVVLLIVTSNDHGMAEQRQIFIKLIMSDCVNPVIISRKYNNIKIDELLLNASTDMGALFVDGLGNGVFIQSDDSSNIEDINQISFGILQASRTRISKTEYISCPSCGRTLFDLQETTAKIRERTDHLVGVKIGIMGCIVNGPGEMADADYGYVGTGIGKISLYRGQDVVLSNISANDAVDALIDLMKEDNVWVEPTLLEESL